MSHICNSDGLQDLLGLGVGSREQTWASGTSVFIPLPRYKTSRIPRHLHTVLFLQGKMLLTIKSWHLFWTFIFNILILQKCVDLVHGHSSFMEYSYIQVFPKFCLTLQPKHWLIYRLLFSGCWQSNHDWAGSGTHQIRRREGWNIRHGET